VTGKVLIVDDEPELRYALRRILTRAGHTVVEAESGAEALRRLLEHAPVDVVLLDLNLPDGSGLEILSTIRASGAAVGVVVFTGSDASADMRDALARGATGYLHKPADPLSVEAQVSVALAQARRATFSAGLAPAVPESAPSPGGVSDLLEQLPLNLADQLSHAWDLRHVETGAHVRRMAESTRCLAVALGSSQGDASRLGRVAMLHDLGKIAIPDAILTKPGKLTAEEFAIMKRHAEIGGKLLSGSNHPLLDLAAQVARSHHERWNGTGYPDGLVGTACPWEARVVGVVDVYDALGQTRCYKAAWPRERLREFFAVERGKSFDSDIVDGLFSVWAELETVKSEHPDPVVAEPVGAAPIEVEHRVRAAGH
jgi:putative two-component system response regulator